MVEAVTGRVELVLAEDAVEEVFDVPERRFGRHPSIGSAVDLLTELLSLAVLVPRGTYRDSIERWSRQLRDPSDAPIVAYAVAVGARYLVSGDEDGLVLKLAESVQIRKTRVVLAAIAEA